MHLLHRLLVLLLVVGIGLPGQAAPTSQLSSHYKQWIDEDVPYIINKEERAAFLRLRSDPERDKFIEQFWETRNPDRNSSINVFKEEHYRRLAYVRANFGDDRYNDGWRSDMGRVYITLGPPKQTAKYHMGNSTRPVEIWFYQSTSPALPPYFNVVFFKRGDADPYTLYSPRENGPTAIVTNDVHDDAAALHTIQQSMGAEAAHAMETLLPDEAVDLKNPRPTMLSDFLLEAIRDLPDQKLEKERIALYRKQEHVTTSIFTGANTSSLDTAVLRDASGRETVHFLMRNSRLDSHILTVTPNTTRASYNMILQTRVISADGKAIYQQRDVLRGSASEAGAKVAGEKLFAAEGRLPLVPGTYDIEATLTNELTHEATRSNRKVVVPAVKADSIGISDLVAYTTPSPVRDPEGQLPFSISQLRFTPRGPQTVQIHYGEQLPIIYQIWFPASDIKASESATPKLVHVHYLLGSVAGSSGQTLTEEDEDVQVKNLDAAGNLLTGRTLDTSQLSLGTYRLVVKVTEPGTTRAAFATMTVKVLPAEATIAMWTAYGSESEHPAWQDDILRGIAAEAIGNPTEAAVCYRRALSANADATEAQTRLNALNKKLAAHSNAGQ